jgi:hypothetical protein
MWFYHNVKVHDLTLKHHLSCRQKNTSVIVILVGFVRLEGEKISSIVIDVVCTFKVTSTLTYNSYVLMP